ncbi:hypothetical protein [Brevibacillus choshinensis]|uniref:Uncharacterized protein n=1 Tax=Brevibacillus choshinensis TaxID=54911 RepID=A0ABX7FH23_BRECH|nr:hypothetical protein [Brevibacillus choshinensis]QRG65518.1 hypothetical protein JNE38_18035 [Brevibacillus choshinensis]
MLQDRETICFSYIGSLPGTFKKSRFICCCSSLLGEAFFFVLSGRYISLNDKGERVKATKALIERQSAALLFHVHLLIEMGKGKEN